MFTIMFPDGSHLLYTGWSHRSQDGVIAVPIDPDAPPIVLTGELGHNSYNGSPWIPLQPVAGTGPLGWQTSHEVEQP